MTNLVFLPAWVDTYIDALRATGLEATARGVAQVSKRAVQELEAAHIEFSEAVNDAKAKWADKLEAEAYRRGVDGIEKGIYYQGELVARETQYSDTLLQTLLKAKRPEEFGDKRQITGAGGEPLTVHIRTFSDQPAPPPGAQPALEGVFHELLDVIQEEISADDLA